MEMDHRKRLLLKRLLEERRKVLPRPARQFLEGLLGDEELLSRMRFCRASERSRLRNSVLIATEDAQCWAVLLDNDPEGARGGAHARARMALEGLDLSPAQVLERLKPLPVWFLAVDPPVEQPPAGEAVQLDRTIHGLAAIAPGRLRRLALLDQIDAALDAGDREGYERLRVLLLEVPDA